MTDREKNKKQLENISFLIKAQLIPELIEKREILFKKYCQRHEQVQRNRLFHPPKPTERCQCSQCINNPFRLAQDDVLFYTKMILDLESLVKTLSQIIDDNQQTSNDLDIILEKLSGWINNEQENAAHFISLPEQLSDTRLQKTFFILGGLIAIASEISSILFVVMMSATVNPLTMLVGILLLSAVIPLFGFLIAKVGKEKSKLQTDVSKVCFDAKKLQELNETYKSLWDDPNRTRVAQTLSQISMM